MAVYHLHNISFYFTPFYYIIQIFFFSFNFLPQKFVNRFFIWVCRFMRPAPGGADYPLFKIDKKNLPSLTGERGEK
jgi:hypothetical protein